MDARNGIGGTLTGLDLRAEIDTFLEDRIFKRDWYDSAALRTIWQRHQAGAINADRLIHNLITTELWYDHFGHID